VGNTCYMQKSWHDKIDNNQYIAQHLKTLAKFKFVSGNAYIYLNHPKLRLMTTSSGYHERQATRLQGYDYTRGGLYFITIRAKMMDDYFGTIENQKIELNEIGQKANQYWLDIPDHYSRVKLHEHVIMPDHVHGIIELKPADDAGLDIPVVGPCHGMALQPEYPNPSANQNKFGHPISGSISMIVNQYKSSVKRWCNKNGYRYFQWQSRFYDHIIRDYKSYMIITNYIRENPSNWGKRTFPKL
jgi:putative transposase